MTRRRQLSTKPWRSWVTVGSMFYFHIGTKKHNNNIIHRHKCLCLLMQMQSMKSISLLYLRSRPHVTVSSHFILHKQNFITCGTFKNRDEVLLPPLQLVSIVEEPTVNVPQRCIKKHAITFKFFDDGMDFWNHCLRPTPYWTSRYFAQYWSSRTLRWQSLVVIKKIFNLLHSSIHLHDFQSVWFCNAISQSGALLIADQCSSIFSHSVLKVSAI